MGHEILEKVKKDMDDKNKKVDESFHLYRQSGLGVSATIITLNVLHMGTLLNAFSSPIKDIQWAVISSGATFFGIFWGLAIQVFNYVGLKLQADRYFPQSDEKPDVWFTKKTKSANAWFTRAQESLWIALACSAIGFILGVPLLVRLKRFL